MRRARGTAPSRRSRVGRPDHASSALGLCPLLGRRPWRRAPSALVPIGGALRRLLDHPVRSGWCRPELQQVVIDRGPAFEDRGLVVPRQLHPQPAAADPVVDDGEVERAESPVAPGEDRGVRGDGTERGLDDLLPPLLLQGRLGLVNLHLQPDPPRMQARRHEQVAGNSRTAHAVALARPRIDPLAPDEVRPALHRELAVADAQFTVIHGPHHRPFRRMSARGQYANRH